MSKNARSFFPIPRSQRPPLDRLRAAHILTRFADPNGFAQKDPDAWVSKEAQSLQPDLDTWNWLIHTTACDEYFTGREIETLRRACDPWEFPKTSTKSSGLDERMQALLGSLDPYKATVYQGFNPDPLLIHPGLRGNIAYRIETDPASELFALQPLDTTAVVDTLLKTWLIGSKKADRARKELIEAGELGVQVLDADYGNEFDEATATTPDGALVITVDYVVLFADTSPKIESQLYLGKAFKDDKLDLDPTFDPEMVKVDETSTQFFDRSNGVGVSPVRKLVNVMVNFQRQKLPQVMIFAKGNAKTILMSHLQATGSKTFPPGGMPLA